MEKLQNIAHGEKHLGNKSTQIGSDCRVNQTAWSVGKEKVRRQLLKHVTSPQIKTFRFFLLGLLGKVCLDFGEVRLSE